VLQAAKIASKRNRKKCMSPPGADPRYIRIYISRIKELSA
jgi:hypothetical protein